MQKQDLALNNQQWLTCHKTKITTFILIYLQIKVELIIL